MTLEHPPALSYARDLLRERQEQWAKAPPTRDGYVDALAAATDREKGCVREGDRLRAGPFTYDLQSERERFARSRAVIERVSPGWAEDGHYLEILARQAASIEMLLDRHLRETGQDAKALERILVGTIAEPRSLAWTRAVENYAVIAVAAGMMTSYYQLAKAAVLSWQPIDPPPGSAVGLDPRPASVEKVLDRDPAGVETASACLISWLFEGEPHPNSTRAPEPKYRPHLAHLIDFSERFVLAHEYAHALIDQFGYTIAGIPPKVVSPQEKELRADIVGAWIVSESAALLDSVPPNIALSAAVMAMKVHELVDDGLRVLGLEPPTSSTHPSFELRAKVVYDFYAANYAQLIEQDPSLAPEAILPPARTLEQIWARVEPQIEDLAFTGLEPSDIWYKAGARPSYA
ncbi:hypothetical protein ACLBXX_00520 [Microbacterium sp. C23T]